MIQRSLNGAAEVIGGGDPSLNMFNDDILPRVGTHSLRHRMLIDGNDQRGWPDDGFPIDDMRRYVDDINPKRSPISSRDCPEFTITTPTVSRFLLVVNHLKSKGYGGKAANDRRRKEQAARIAEIFRDRRAAGIEDVAIVGDLNDTRANIFGDNKMRSIWLFPLHEPYVPTNPPSSNSLWGRDVG